MAQTQICRGTATRILTEDGTTSVFYHNTKVISWTDKQITLNSGGYRTFTTKLRMNQASNQFGLGIQVYQKSHEWYVSTPSGDVAFHDGMVLAR